MPYFALKRLYQPFQVFFSKDDYIGVWLVNDTLEVQEGTVYIKLFHLNKNAATKFMKKTFRIRPDESLFLTDLNAFGQFLMNENILYAKVTDKSGKVMTEMTDYVDIERHMEFPDAKLTITDEGDVYKRQIHPRGLPEALSITGRTTGRERVPGGLEEKGSSVRPIHI